MVLLGVAAALGLSAAPLVVLVGGIVGDALAPAAALATLPIAALVVGAALNTVPAAFWMRRVGRRWGFITGAAVGTGGALLAVHALDRASFAEFCAATLLIGASGAFVQQYRFAAAESVAPRSVGRAVSLVLLGGMAAGLIGPEIGRRARAWTATEHAGGFLAVAALDVVAVALLLLLRVAPEPPPAAGPKPRFRPGDLLRRPDFALALAAATIAYAVMSFIMVGTPVSMHVIDGHSIGGTTAVIQGHVLAMYAPSLFTGTLLDRLGVRRMMTLGATSLLAAVATAATSHALAAYGIALVLLGLGWNFLFVGGTVLLTRSYRAEERFRAQALNDFVVFATQAVAALAAGAALDRIGWAATNLAVVPLILLMLVLVVVLGGRAAALPAPAASIAEAQSPVGG